MDQSILRDAALLGAVLDAYPAPSLVVDRDVRALFINRSARKALGLEGEAAEQALIKRGGHILHCIHARETPEGCGRAPACRSCVIRNSVNTAFATNTVYRARAFLEIESPTGVLQAHFLVSAAAVKAGAQEAAILTLEDISDLVKLTSLLPICYHCRKVRNEQDYWQTVEDYFKEKADIDFSHALCAECLELHYPKTMGH
jgi:PAS domain-containing protein